MPEQTRLHWPNGFANSKLVTIYKRELFWLAHQIGRKSEVLFTKYPTPTSYYTSIDAESLDLIYSILGDASKFIEAIQPQRGNPAYAERAAHLQELLAGVDLKALLDKKMRNTIEHFSEYLDDANLIHSTWKPKKLYQVAFNIVFSHLYQVEDPAFPFPIFLSPLNNKLVAPVRVYDASTRTLHNLSWSVDIGALDAAARRVRDALRPTFNEPEPEQWFAGLVAIGPP
jgi:hypothetical protein